MPAPPTTHPSNRVFITALALMALVLCGGLAVGGWLAAQQVRLLPSVTRPASKTMLPVAVPRSPYPAITEETGPTWRSLAEAQQQALEPLHKHWGTLTEAQKRKWISMAGGFHKLSEANQQKMQERMLAWAALTPEERNRARLNYAATRKITAPAKQEQWDAYQALSEDAKRALAARAATKLQGAAIAVRPPAGHKFVRVPAADTDTAAKAANAPKVLPPVVDMVPVPVPPQPAPVDGPSGAPTSSDIAPAAAEPVPMPTATVTELPPLPEETAAPEGLTDNPPPEPVAPEVMQEPAVTQEPDTTQVPETAQEPEPTAQ